jgi:cytochrome c
MKNILIPTALLACAALAPVQVSEKPKAEALVKEAVAFAKANGKDKLLKEINLGSGRFHVASDKVLYVFMDDLKGVCVAHGFSPKYIGTNRWEVKDPDGKPYIQDMVKLAQGKGKGWVDYKFNNPATSKVEPKTTYVEAWDGNLVAYGIYR